MEPHGRPVTYKRAQLIPNREAKINDLIDSFVMDPDARMFVRHFMSACQFYDDLVDGDAKVGRFEKSAFLQIVFHDIPGNPFFDKHKLKLLPILRKIVADWSMATDMELSAHDDPENEECLQALRVSYEMRNGFFDIVSVVVDILQGSIARDEFMASWIPLTRGSQSFESYVEKVTAGERPAKTPYSSAGGDLQRHDHFATPIYERTLDLDVDGLLGEIRAMRDKDPEGMERSNVKASGAWHSSEADLWRQDAFIPLSQQIISTLWMIAEEFGYSREFPFLITGMWANVLPQGGFNKPHMHPNSLWAGVFYVQAEGEGTITFSDPRPTAHVIQPMVKDAKALKPLADPTVKFMPEPNRLLLFPGYLMHEVEPNMGEKSRVSIAFNVTQNVELNNVAGRS